MPWNEAFDPASMRHPGPWVHSQAIDPGGR
jgi:hypothetical protein